MEEQLIWVDNEDKVIGYGEKIYTHRIGQLHRAFSVFVYDLTTEKLLIQKRSTKKYHSGGLWSNSCCSHQRRNETWQKAITRCLKDELRIDVNINNIEDIALSAVTINNNGIYRIGHFSYFVNLGLLSEHEFDHVYVYACDNYYNDFNFNREEIDDIKWIDLHELDERICDCPEEFTAWFEDAYKLVRERICIKK